MITSLFKGIVLLLLNIMCIMFVLLPQWDTFIHHAKNKHAGLDHPLFHALPVIADNPQESWKSKVLDELTTIAVNTGCIIDTSPPSPDLKPNTLDLPPYVHTSTLAITIHGPYLNIQKFINVLSRRFPLSKIHSIDIHPLEKSTPLEIESPILEGTIDMTLFLQYKKM